MNIAMSEDTTRMNIAMSEDTTSLSRYVGQGKYVDTLAYVRRRDE
jgi:hypothetical protein